MARRPVGATIHAPALEADGLSESYVLSIPNYPIWRNRPGELPTPLGGPVGSLLKNACVLSGFLAGRGVKGMGPSDRPKTQEKTRDQKGESDEQVQEPLHRFVTAGSPSFPRQPADRGA